MIKLSEIFVLGRPVVQYQGRTYSICTCSVNNKTPYLHWTLSDSNFDMKPEYPELEIGRSSALGIPGFAINVGMSTESPEDAVVDYYLEKFDIDIRKWLNLGTSRVSIFGTMTGSF